jgi:choline dehydrogenase-like flavoprotein
MSQMQHYDVIIIGTGAGGGTLAYALAPSGKRILILERGDYVPREKDNWEPRAVNVEAKYNTKEVWRDPDGQPCIRTRTTMSAAIPGSTAQHYSGCVGKISARLNTTAGFRPRGQSPIRSLSHITLKRSASTTSTANAARIPLSPRPAPPTHILR